MKNKQVIDVKTRELRTFLHVVMICFIATVCLIPSLSASQPDNIENKPINMIKKTTEKPISTQQQRKITGKTIDSNGESLPGVAIQVLGTPRGVTTDIDGSFSIDVKESDKLVFSYLGMENQTVAVANKKELIVTLKEKMDELEEVTVVAFAKQKKRIGNLVYYQCKTCRSESAEQ